MSGDEIARLVFLVLLGIALGGYVVAQNRNRLGRALRQATAWIVIFAATVAAVGLWHDIRTPVMPQQSVFADAGRVEVPRAADGHYYLLLEINDTPVRFVVDTGASDVVLTREDARRIGLNPDTLPYVGSAHTANGIVQTAITRLDRVRLGNIEDRNLRAWVNGGEMKTSLLGMAYLQTFESIELRRNRLILTR